MAQDADVSNVMPSPSLLRFRNPSCLLLSKAKFFALWHAGSVPVARTRKVLNLIIESLRIVVRGGKREEMRRALAAWIGPTQVESGGINCRILHEEHEPHSFYYEARWKTPDDLMRHLRSEHYKRLLVLMDLGEDPPVVEFHTVVETKGFDLLQQ